MEKFDPSKMKVELRRHYGKQGILLAGQTKEVEVDLRQCRVFVDGQCVGIYCGLEDQPGKHLSFTDNPPLPQAVQEAISEAVAKQTGGISHFTGVAPEPHEEATEDEPE